MRTEHQSLAYTMLSEFEIFRFMPTSKRDSGLSEATYKGLVGYVHRFSLYRLTVPERPLDIAFIDWLSLLPVSQNTKYNISRALGKFFYIRSIEGFTKEQYDKVRRVFLPLPQEYSEYALTEEHIARLIRCFLERNSFSGRRDAAITALLALSGLRISQLLELNLATSNLEVRQVNGSLIHILTAQPVTRKKRQNIEQSKPIPLLPIADVQSSDIVGFYDTERRKQAQALVQAPDAPYFTNAQGKRLTARYIQKTLAEAGRIIGIQDANPHAFRHYFAQKVAERHGVHAVRMALSHTHLSTSQRYLRATPLSETEYLAMIV